MDIRVVSLKNFSSLRIGGEGKLVVVRNEEELQEAVMHAEAAGCRVHIIGQGTNSYFGDDLSEFLFVQLDMKGISFDGEAVNAYASVVWDDLVVACVSRGLWGIENLSYIPGTVGAAPVQNIGAYGAELADTFVSCEAFDTTDGTVKTLNKEACHFGYRDSIFKHETGRYIILSVTLLLSRERSFILTYKPLDELLNKADLSVEEVRDSVIKVRRSKLPEWRENPNCGSFFKNPVVTKAQSEGLRVKYPALPLIEIVGGFKVPAAWLIEHVAEMKEVRVGGLHVWHKQSLVIVNDAEATADDVDVFVQEIIGRIEAKTGIYLEQEVNRVR